MFKTFLESFEGNREPLESYISTFTDVLPNDILSSFLELVNFQNFNKKEKASVGLDYVIDSNIRDAYFMRLPICSKPITKKILNSVHELLTTYINKYNFDLNIIDFQFEQSFLYYENQKGYMPHVDSLSFDSTKRLFTTITYFNDNFIGGELYFPNLNLTLPIKQNSTIIFPSNKFFVHGARKVYGRKVISPCWFGYEKREKFVFPWEVN
jgi:hypothetical protein